MADGILTKQEESRLREFRDRLALDSNTIDSVQLTSYLYPRQCQRKGRTCPLEGTYRTRPLAGSSYLPRDLAP